MRTKEYDFGSIERVIFRETYECGCFKEYVHGKLRKDINFFRYGPRCYRHMGNYFVEFYNFPLGHHPIPLFK